MDDCFYCSDEQQGFAIDALGEMLDGGVPPSWIIEKMLEVISLVPHFVDEEIGAVEEVTAEPVTE